MRHALAASFVIALLTAWAQPAAGQISPSGGTFVAINTPTRGSDITYDSIHNVYFIELNRRGAPFSAPLVVSSAYPTTGTFYPRVTSQAAHLNWALWFTTFSRDFAALMSQWVLSTTLGGGSDAPLTSAPPSGGDGSCTTPDPFASLGGGTCSNGGWYPSASQPPPPPPIGCTTPDPFVSLGGGVCINGGWIPRSAVGG